MRGVSEKSNNMYLLAMVSTAVRATIALHSLINNKIGNLEIEKEKEAADKKKEEKAEKAAKKIEAKEEAAGKSPPSSQ